MVGSTRSVQYVDRRKAKAIPTQQTTIVVEDGDVDANHANQGTIPFFAAEQ